MSGGAFNFQDSNLKYEIFGYGDQFHNALEDREISKLVWDMLNLLHDYDWYTSGDTCEETWLKAKRAFKKKWLKPDPERAKVLIDEAVSELKDELYKTFVLDEHD